MAHPVHITSHMRRVAFFAIFVVILLNGMEAFANCGPEWAPERKLPVGQPLDPRLLAQLPVSAVYAQIYSPFYLAYLSQPPGSKAWIDAVAREPAERRPLLELGLPITVWPQGRSTVEFLRGLFAGPVGDRAPEIAQALDAIGAARQADALRRAVAMFGPDFPRESQARSGRLGLWDQPSALAHDLMALFQAFGEREDSHESDCRPRLCDASAFRLVRCRPADDERL